MIDVEQYGIKLPGIIKSIKTFQGKIEKVALTHLASFIF